MIAVEEHDAIDINRIGDKIVTNDLNFKGFLSLKYGMLTPMFRVAGDRWRFKCECGKEKDILMGHVKSGRIISCRCVGSKNLHKITHKKTRTPSYVSWVGMKGRCLNEKDRVFSMYGGRGIKICDKWMDFEGFFEDMGERQKGYTLERIDVNGDYCKENCRWATQAEQSRNRRISIDIEIDGVTKKLPEWCHDFNITPSVAIKRIKRGWNKIDAVTTPTRRL